MKTLTKTLTVALAALLLSAAPASYSASDGLVSAQQIESAKTSMEHEAVAKMFEDEAAELTKKADTHADMAKTFGKPGLKPAQAAVARHCRSLARDYRAAAKENLALAAIHHKVSAEISK